MKKQTNIFDFISMDKKTKNISSNIAQSKSIITLGLDLGKTSIGWALVDTYNNYKIIDCGVRLFDAPETPKDQISLNKIRSENIRARNSNINYNFRRKKISQLLINYGLVKKELLNKYNKFVPKSKKRNALSIKMANYLCYKKNTDVLSLRAKSLNTKISPFELAKILYSLNNHRGINFDTFRDINENANSTQKEYQESLNKYNDEYLNNKDKYRSYGEFLYFNYSKKFRNTNLKDKNGKKTKKKDLVILPSIEAHIEEIKTIFEMQRNFGNEVASKKLEKEYLNWFEYEKGSPSYLELVSQCSILETEKCVSKNSLEGLLYVSLEKLYNLRYKKSNDKEYSKLTIEEMKLLISSVKTKEGMKYLDIEKILKKEDLEFKGIVDKSSVCFSIESFISLGKIIPLKDTLISEYLNADSIFNKVLEILIYQTSDESKIELLKEFNLDNETIENLLKHKFRGHLSYSSDVTKTIVDNMFNGKNPHDSKEYAKNFYGIKTIKKSHYLPPVLDTDFPLKNNHTVVRALSQLRLVINDILKKYRKEFNNSNWSFDKVVIELARDMNSDKSIKEINKKIKENTKQNELAKDFCEKHGLVNPNKSQILKAKLYLIQNGFELYPTLDSNSNIEYRIIEAEKVFTEGYCEIDHTLPFSRSLDDSISNKTLVLSDTNQNKGDKTPYEFLGENLFKNMNNSLFKKAKQLGFDRVKKLLTKSYQGVDGFKQRDIVDTQIISKYAGLYIEKHLMFFRNPLFSKIRRVYANNGKITNLLRKSWAIGSKNRNNHLHHCEDAILIACSEQSLIQNISTFINLQHKLNNDFIDEEKFEKIFYKHKSLKEYILKSLKDKDISIEDLQDKDKYDDLISKIYKIIAFKNLPYKTFIDDFKTAINNAKVTHFEKEKVNGEIHEETIKSAKNVNTNKKFLTRQGFAKDGAFIRYDVFREDKSIKKEKKYKYHFVKITAKYYGLEAKKLPTIENAEFMFSIYKNSTLRIKNKDNIEFDSLFRKKPSSLVLDDIFGKEDFLFKNKIINFNFNILGSDNISKSVLNDIFNNKPNLKDFKEDNNLNTTYKNTEDYIMLLKKYLQSNLNNYNVVFISRLQGCFETKTILKKLIEKNIISEYEKIGEQFYKENTVFVYIDENKVLPSRVIIGATAIKDIKKLKITPTGSINIIEKEKRKDMK
jgi:CRISPR-associated endonuclease Csn1